MKIHRAGTELECILPNRYDDRTRIVAAPIGIVVVHPDFPPMYLKDGELCPLIYPNPQQT